MRKVKISIVTGVFILLFFNLMANAWGDMIIKMEKGSFILKNLSFSSDVIGPYFKGDVLNNTSKDWNRVIFEVDFYDSSGNRIENTYGGFFKFAIFDLKKGETKPIGGAIGMEYMFGLKSAIVSRYEIRFGNGEYPAKYIFVMTKPKDNRELLFEDDFLRILFSISEIEIGFLLHNKTSNPIKIDWDQVSYVDVSSESHKVMHSGVKYIDREKPQAPTVLPPTAKLNDIIFPTDYVFYTSGKYGKWSRNPLFPDATKAELYKGKSFSVFIPFEINGVIKNYFFTFNIEDVEI